MDWFNNHDLVQDHARPVRPRSTSELLDALAAMSSHSLAPGLQANEFSAITLNELFVTGAANSRLPVVAASPGVTRSRLLASHLCAVLSLQFCAQSPASHRLQGFFYDVESFRV